MRVYKSVLALLLVTTPAAAQRDFSKVEVKVEQLAPGIAVLFGAGGNIGLSYGEDGNVLIDDQFAPLTDKISAAVATLDPDPVRFVINTHWHPDHSGGNENLGKRGAVIIAHDNVRIRLSRDTYSQRFKETFKALPKVGLPVVTFAQGVRLHLNGDTLNVVHVPHAHTDGDALIYWEKGNVLHMGDTFFHRMSFPFIDFDSGGSIDGVIAAANKGLALANAQTRIIPGHGPVASYAEFKAYRDMIVDVRAKVAAGIRAKKSKAAIVTSKPAAAYKIETTFITADDFVSAIYDSLTRRRRG